MIDLALAKLASYSGLLVALTSKTACFEDH
jgi:hypothetical protein